MSEWQALDNRQRDHLRRLWREWLDAQAALRTCPTRDGCAQCHLAATDAATAWGHAAIAAHARNTHEESA